MKKCNHCNQLLEDDAKFCPVCGNKIEETNPENEESSQVTTTNSDYSYYNQNNRMLHQIIKKLIHLV